MPHPPFLPHPVNARLCKGLLQLLVVADKLVVIPHIEIDLQESRNVGDDQSCLQGPRGSSHTLSWCAQAHALRHPKTNALSDWPAIHRSKHHPLSTFFMLTVPGCKQSMSWQATAPLHVCREKRNRGSLMGSCARPGHCHGGTCTAKPRQGSATAHPAVDRNAHPQFAPA